MLRHALLAVVCAALCGGCVMEQMVKGQWYLTQKDYAAGITDFRLQVREAPDSASAHYYLGRLLLASDKPKEALAALQKAEALNPGDKNLLFWLGVAYGETGDQARERAQYAKVLAMDEDHLQALTYLAHLELREKKYAPALATYAKVLEIWPGSPSALYNRALIMQRLGRTPEEKLGWQEYLAHYASGALTRRAVQHLNALGDFEYRNHILGHRTVTLEKIQFEPFTADIWKGSRPSLDLVGDSLRNNPRLVLHVIAYQLRHKALAKARALAVKKYLTDHFDTVDEARIKASWFAVPETVTAGGKTIKRNESINIFGTLAK